MRVSIIIPYKEDRGYLDAALESIKEQTYPNIEVIKVHNDLPVGHNLNIGIEQSTGDIIRYLCDDDLLPPDSVARTVSFFATHPEADWVHANATNFWPHRSNIYKPEKKEPTLHQLAVHNHIHGGTVAYRRRCFERERFNETLWTGEEYEFNLRLLAAGYKLGYLDHITYKYRRHDKQKSLGNTDIKYQEQRRQVINAIKSSYLPNANWL